MPNNYKIEIWKSVLEIEENRSVWEEVASRELEPSINSDIDRYLSVLKASGDDVKPYIIVFRQNGQPVAMIIGRIEKMPLQMKLGYKTLFKPKLKCLTIVYGGILGQPGQELCSLLIEELMKVLNRRETDVVYFNHLQIDSQFYSLVINKVYFLRKNYPQTQPHWQTHIPDNVASFYERIPSKHKREWRRCERKLVEECGGPVEVLSYRKKSQIDYIIRVASDISKRSYKHAMNVGITDDACTRALLSQAAEDDSLRAYILYVNNVPCAFEFGVHYRDTFFAEYMGYDPALSLFGPGALLWIKVIEDLCSDSATNMLDYGFGDASYKQRFGTKVWHEASIYIFAPRVYPIAVNMLQSAVTGLSLWLKDFLDKVDFTRWIKRRWRNLLKKNSKG